MLSGQKKQPLNYSLCPLLTIQHLSSWKGSGLTGYCIEWRRPISLGLLCWVDQQHCVAARCAPLHSDWLRLQRCSLHPAPTDRAGGRGARSAAGKSSQHGGQLLTFLQLFSSGKRCSAHTQHVCTEVAAVPSSWLLLQNILRRRWEADQTRTESHLYTPSTLSRLRPRACPSTTPRAYWATR